MTKKPAAMVLGLAALIIVGIAESQYFSGDDQGAGGLAKSPRFVSGSESSAIELTPEEPATAPDVAEIVLTSQNAAEGWAVDTTSRGREVLAHLIRYGQVPDDPPGFIDARATEFCADGQGCGTSWVALYESVADADAAFAFIHDEMQVGWGLGFDGQGLYLGGDEGHAYSNNLGNAAAHHAYLWRNGALLLGVIGLADPVGVDELEADALWSIAEEMNARSR